jgi:hypothetical protein
MLMVCSCSVVLTGGHYGQDENKTKRINIDLLITKNNKKKVLVAEYPSN